MPKATVTATAVDSLVVRIAADFPQVAFVEDQNFLWHAGKQRVSYKKHNKTDVKDTLALLHEVGHAMLAHRDFTYDIELLQLEVAAWEQARELAKRYHVTFDEEYVQDCLDTYRDWLHLRATCPACFARALQATQRRYRCFNCQTEWQVSRSRLCRPYRLKTPQKT